MPSPFDKDLNNFKQGEIDNLSLGQNGFVAESGTDAVTESVFCIVFVTAGAFSALTGENIEGDAITGFTFPAGFHLYGRFSTFTLASGSVIAYKYAD